MSPHCVHHFVPCTQSLARCKECGKIIATNVRNSDEYLRWNKDEGKVADSLSERTLSDAER